MGKRTQGMLRRINQALPELVLGIVVYGVLAQVAGIWFAQDKILYTTGLWMGVALAVGMAVNMAIVILDTVDAIAEGHSARKAPLYSVLRYLVVVLAFVVVWRFRLGNVIAMFAGVMGLKASAYLQPVTHKFIVAIQGKGLCSRRIKKR